jgi:hypothetical protein
MTAVDQFLGRLQHVRVNSGGWAASCPCPTHGSDGIDSHPSLMIWEKDGKPYFKCHTGCGKQDVLSAMGLTMRDLNSDDGRSTKQQHTTRRPAKRIVSDPLDWLAKYANVPCEFINTLPISVDGDDLVFEFSDLTNHKRRSAGQKKFSWTTEGASTPPLWPMPGQSLPECVWITEGETDCIVARYVGRDAYSLTHGAMSVLTPTQAGTLADRGVSQVVLCLDSDKAGQDALDKHVAPFRSVGLEVSTCDLSLITDAFTGAKDLRDLWTQSNGDVATFGRRLDKCVSATQEKESGRNESWTPVPITELPGETELDWVWDGFLAYGLVTDMYGLWKAGKSTLIGALLHHMGDGGDLAGRSVCKGRVLVVTEETSALWKRRRDHMTIGSHVHIIPRPFKGGASWEQWEALVEHVGRLASDYDLVIIDALPSLWPVMKENEAGEVLRAIRPLHACVENTSLLLVRHPRKGDGSEATAGRGSGALSGFVDIIVEFRRYQGDDTTNTRRALKVYSRDEPFECVVDWDGGFGYDCIGDKSDASREDRIEVVISLLHEYPDTTLPEMLEKWPKGRIVQPGRATLQGDLDEAQCSGRLHRSGEGKKGSPYRWKLDSDEPGLFDTDQAA